MKDDLNKAELAWRKRSLFAPRRQRSLLHWLLLSAAVVVAVSYFLQPELIALLP